MAVYPNIGQRQAVSAARSLKAYSEGRDDPPISGAELRRAKDLERKVAELLRRPRSAL